MIFDRLAEIVAEHGVVTRAELESLQVGAETRRIIDRNRGIWNPQGLLATLSVVSDPEGPYADAHLGDSSSRTTTGPEASTGQPEDVLGPTS